MALVEIGATGQAQITDVGIVDVVALEAGDLTETIDVILVADRSLTFPVVIRTILGIDDTFALGDVTVAANAATAGAAALAVDNNTPQSFDAFTNDFWSNDFNNDFSISTSSVRTDQGLYAIADTPERVRFVITDVAGRGFSIGLASRVRGDIFFNTFGSISNTNNEGIAGTRREIAIITAASTSRFPSVLQIKFTTISGAGPETMTVHEWSILR